MNADSLPVLTATRPSFSIFTSDNGSLTKNITKRPGGGIDKAPAAEMSRGHVATIRLDSFDDFARALTRLEKNQALGYGLSIHGDGPVMSNEKWLEAGRPAGVTTRTKNCFAWPSGAGIMMLDYDAPESGNALNRDELLDALYAIVPELREAAHIWATSASSCIYDADTGEQLVGTGGQRVYVLVANGCDIERAGAALFDRSWLHGHGRYVVSKAGSLLERTLIDGSVWQAQRLDFAAGAVCGSGLEQRRGDPVHYGGAVPMDTRRITNLNGSERDEVAKLKAAAKAAQSGAARERRKVWLETRGESISKARSIPLAAARDIAKQAIDGGVLSDDFLLTANDGRTVSVADLLNAPAMWHGQYFLDPIEPNANRKSAAWARLHGGEPALFAHAHGGTWYRLGRSDNQERFDRFIEQCMSKATDPSNEELSEMGNAVRFARQHGKNARWVFEFRKWLLWDGQRWIFADAGEVMRYAKATVLSIHGEAEQAGDLKKAEAIARHAIRSQTSHALQGMLSLAQSEPGISLSQSHLDSNPMLLGVSNSVIDLTTGMARAPARQDYITKLGHVAHDDRATCPAWTEFLQGIFGGDKALIAYVQRAVGYSLTGSTAEQCLFFLYGTGSNGKSTFLGALKALMGDYAAQCSADSLMVKTGGGGGSNASGDIARLRGARLVSAIEAEDGKRMAESLIKQMTGGDTVVARFLYQENFEFIPQFKLWLAANHKPVIRGTDFAIWRRIHLVPFTVTIAEGKKDKRLPEKLAAESPGILNWALEGCAEWQRLGGLNPPAAVTGATDAYREEMDVFGAWLKDCCSTGTTYEAGGGQLYTSYRAWCESEGSYPLSNVKFSGKLEERGFRKERTAKGVMYWGLRLG